MIVSNLKREKGIPVNKLIYLLLSSSILTTVLAQFFIKSEFYQIMRLALYALFLLTFMLVLLYNKSIPRNKFLNFYLMTTYVAITFSLLISFHENKLVLNTLIEFVLPFVILCLGYISNINKDQLEKILLKYMVLVSALGLFVIFVFGSGFQITSQYFFAPKNQVGPFVASVAMMSLVSIFNGNKTNNLNVNKKILFSIFVVNLSSLLVIRNRSGMVALGVCLFIFLISNIRFEKQVNKGILSTPLFVLASFLILKSKLGVSLLEVLNKSFFTNYDASNLNSLSAGRFDVYLDVLNFIKTSPLFGEITTISTITETPHNYLLFLWLNYGVLGMLPITAFYIFLWGFVIYKTALKKEFDLSYYLILFMLVISLFEYTYPFSPLTTVSLAWFLFGYSFKPKNNF